MSSVPVNPDDAFGLLRSFLRHRGFVQEALNTVAQEIGRRATVHDLSKMADDEFAGFTRVNAAARINKFGSPEYAEGLKRERPTIDLHFSRNSHHPERPHLLAAHGSVKEQLDYQSGNGPEMSFLDVIEMVCDWWGARKGYDDPRSWADTVKLNFESKGKYLSPEHRWLAEQVAEFLETHHVG